MQSRIPSLVASDHGASWASKRGCLSASGAACLWFPTFLALALLSVGPQRSFGQAIGRDFTSENAEFRIYVPGSFQEIAVCKVEKIFMDHRKLGFFHVQLLPQLVVQGVRLGLADVKPDGGWAEGFRPGWLPATKHDAVEWRDMSVTIQKENAPRLHADRAHPATGGSTTICTFENITLEAGGVTWRAARAELCNEAGRPRVVWHADGGERHWDLFSGEMISNNQELTKVEK